MDRFGADMIAMAHQHLAPAIPDPVWARWAAHLAPAATIAAITAWLEAGQPDPGLAADRITRVLRGVSVAATEDTPAHAAARAGLRGPVLPVRPPGR